MRGWKYSVTCRIEPSLTPTSLAHPPVTRRARLEIGDADHVVVAQGVGEMLGGGDGQCIGMLGVIQRDGLVQPVEIVAAIGDVLVVDDLSQAPKRHVAHRGGHQVDAGGQRLPALQQVLRTADAPCTRSRCRQSPALLALAPRRAARAVKAQRRRRRGWLSRPGRRRRSPAHSFRA